MPKWYDAFGQHEHSTHTHLTWLGRDHAVNMLAGSHLCNIFLICCCAFLFCVHRAQNVVGRCVVRCTTAIFYPAKNYDFSVCHNFKLSMLFYSHCGWIIMAQSTKNTHAIEFDWTVPEYAQAQHQIKKEKQFEIEEKKSSNKRRQCVRMYVNPTAHL